MAGLNEEENLRFKTFPSFEKGMNNIGSPHTLDDDVFRNAVNVDIHDKGAWSRRKGKTKAYDGTIAKGTLWADRGIGLTLFVEGGELKRLNADNTADVIRSSVTNKPMSYVLVNGIVYYSNGFVNGKIVEGNDKPWGVEPPGSQPTLTATTTGELPAGVYQVAVTFVAEDGVESGTGLAGTVTLASSGGIALTGLPQPDVQTHKVRVYVSTASGEILYKYGDFSPYGMVGITRLSETTYPLRTQFGVRPQPFDLACYNNGRIFMAVGSTLYATDPLNYELVMPHKFFFQFAERITVVLPTQDGVYVVADKTYFIKDVDTDNLVQVDSVPYGAAFGSGIEIGNKANEVAWWSEKGLVIAGPGGDAKNVMLDNVAVSNFEQGKLIYREQDGMKQILAVLQNGMQSLYAADDWVASEIARRGNAI